MPALGLGGHSKHSKRGHRILFRSLEQQHGVVVLSKPRRIRADFLDVRCMLQEGWGELETILPPSKQPEWKWISLLEGPVIQ